MRKIIFMLILVMTVITGCSSNKVADNKIIKINKKNILEKINDGYIFFSKKDCPMCNEIYPIVEKELRNQNYKLYYFDFAYMRENNIYTDLELQKICDKYEINLVPLIIEIDGNKEVMRFPTSYEKKTNKLHDELKSFLQKN